MQSERELKFAILSFLGERGPRKKWNTLGRSNQPGDLELREGVRFDHQARGRADRAWEMLKRADLIRPEYADAYDPDGDAGLTASGRAALERHALDDLDEGLAAIGPRLVAIRDEAWSTLERGGPEAFGQAANSMCEVIDQALHLLAPDEEVKARPDFQPDSSSRTGVTRMHRALFAMEKLLGAHDLDACHALRSAHKRLEALKHAHSPTVALVTERALVAAEDALRQVLLGPLGVGSEREESGRQSAPEDTPSSRPRSVADLANEDLEALGFAFHRGERVMCPMCDSQLHVAEHDRMGKIAVPLRFTCIRDGRLGDFEPPDLRVPWAEADVRRMVADHLRHGEARCTYDRAKLKVLYKPSEAGTYLFIGCPSCGRCRDGAFEEPSGSVAAP